MMNRSVKHKIQVQDIQGITSASADDEIKWENNEGVAHLSCPSGYFMMPTDP